MGGGASSRVYSNNLKDIEIIKLLVICSENVYKLNKIENNQNNENENEIMLEKYQLENENNENNIQYGYYKILQGSHVGETILRSF